MRVLGRSSADLSIDFFVAKSSATGIIPEFFPFVFMFVRSIFLKKTFQEDVENPHGLLMQFVQGFFYLIGFWIFKARQKCAIVDSIYLDCCIESNNPNFSK